MQCGSKLQGDGDDSGGRCRACNRRDPLNVKYCVFCGGQVEQGEGSAIGKTASVASLQAPEAHASATSPLRPGATRTAWLTIRSAYRPLATLLASYGISSLPGVLVLVSAAVLGLTSGFLLSRLVLPSALEIFVASLSWPPSGLVIYTSPSRSRVLVTDASGKRFVGGQTGSRGALTIPDLQPGYYRVTISCPEFKTVEKTVVVKADRPSVLGFPERIELPPVQPVK